MDSLPVIRPALQSSSVSIPSDGLAALITRKADLTRRMNEMQERITRAKRACGHVVTPSLPHLRSLYGQPSRHSLVFGRS